MRYLGVDYGSKRVGIALSDEAGTMGFPHAILTNTPRLVDEICSLIVKENIKTVVIGESRNLAGGENPIAKEAHAFGEHLAQRSGVPVHYESEVFTSAQARRAPAPAEGESDSDKKERRTRAPKMHRYMDSSSASLILTSYLSHAKYG